MKLSIIIVSWNTKDIVTDCLASIFRNTVDFLYEVIVVDNASTDGTADCIKMKFPTVRVIESGENKGFAWANNLGVLSAYGDYLFFLNPDTILFDDTLKKLLAFMDDNSDIAMCGPRILNEDRTLQTSVRNFPSWRGAFYRYTILKYLGLFKSHFERWHNRGFDYDKQADIEQLIGAALLIRRVAFEQVGRFDERFFMYYEEVDLCRRLKISGFRVVYYPGAQLVHLGGKSAKQIPARTRFVMLRSLLLYLRKSTPPARCSLLSVLFKIGVLSRQLYELIVFFLGFCISRLSGNTWRMDKCVLRYRSAWEFLAKFYLEFLSC